MCHLLRQWQDRFAGLVPLWKKRRLLLDHASRQDKLIQLIVQRPLEDGLESVFDHLGHVLASRVPGRGVGGLVTHAERASPVR